MADRTYLPYLGDYYQYGYGPEHTFFADAQVSSPQDLSNTSATTQAVRNEYSDNNPYIDAYSRGAGEARDHGGRDTPDSRDPGRTTDNPLGTALNYGGNLLSMGLGPATTLGALGYSMANNKNPQQLGILAALGLSPTGAVNINNLTPDQMLGSPLGQSTGSASQDYFGAINDLATVGQLGAVLDARDENRDVMANGRDYSQYSDFGGGDPAAGPQGPSGAPDAGYAGDHSGNEYAEGGEVMGPTDGQGDHVPALLSHGEYVIDAPTVAALGGGNNEAGARKLDLLRKKIRKDAYGSTEQPKPINTKKLLNHYAGIRG